MDDIADPAAGARARLVAHIRAGGGARHDSVAEAMRTVPRHRFVPGTPIANAYSDEVVVTKRDPNGAALSCASVPTVVAMMLDQLDVRAGDHVLEIGAGTGYNAALLAVLTGATGQVTTIDIDPEVTAGARRALADTGYTDVRVITADGSLGHAVNAPYDRIVVTVGAYDLPPAWWDQLTPGGRLVVPLRWRGQTRSVAFTRADGTLRGESAFLCGFVPMISQDGEHSGHIDRDGRVTLHWDHDQPIDPVTLHGVLDRPKHAVGSGVLVGVDAPFSGVWLRMTYSRAGTCRIAATPAAVDSGLCNPAVSTRSPALVEAGSLAYLTLRRPAASTATHWELGATGHGPHGRDLANQICADILAWDADRTARPVITAYPGHASVDPPAGHRVIRKRHIRLVLGQ